MNLTLTSEQWRLELERELEREERVNAIKLFSAYYDGQHRLQFATSKFKEAFGELFEAFATNWCGLVVDVAVERLHIRGFRLGEDEADDDAWAIWQANSMDARAIIAHTLAVKTGWAYLLVSPPAKQGDEPRITVEHPLQCCVIHDPSDRRIRLAGIKKWREVNGDSVAVVYTPETIATYKTDGMRDRVEAFGLILPNPWEVASGAGGWTKVSEDENTLGVVPLIPLENNPDLLTGGQSDLKSAVALNDAANKFFTDMIHASEFTSFPQRVLTGVELPRDPITGEVVDAAQLRAAVSRLWAFEDENAKVFDLQAAGLSNYVEGVDLAVQHLAAQTRTPPHYLLAKLANLSGDALKAAETGLTARCLRKQIDFSDSWEEAIRLAFKWRSLDRAGWAGADEDARRAAVQDAETLWENPESQNPAQQGDMAVKKQMLGVPNEILWEELGYSPQKIKMIKRIVAEQEAKQAELLAQGLAPVDAGGTRTAQPPTVTTVGSNSAGDLVVGGLAGPALPEDPAAKKPAAKKPAAVA